MKYSPKRGARPAACKRVALVLSGLRPLASSAEIAGQARNDGLTGGIYWSSL